MSQIGVRSLLLASILVSQLGCGVDDPPSSGQPAVTASIGSSSSAASSGAGGEMPCVVPEWVESRWPGWHRWALAPCDCHVFVPDTLESVESPPQWEPCPYMAEGCARATAPWADEWGSGYGHGLFEVALHDGYEYVSVHRHGPDLWTDSFLFRDQALELVWRSRIGAGASDKGDCSLRGPYLSTAFGNDGVAAATVVRLYHETEPWVFLGKHEALLASPQHTEVFGQAGPSPVPTGRVTRSKRLLVLWENYGRFTVRDLTSGETFRPEPAAAGWMTDPMPVDDSVVYGLWTGSLASVWVWNAATGNRALLKDATYAYYAFVTDGEDAVWLRGKDPLGASSYQQIELWTSPFAPTPDKLVPRKVVTIETTSVSKLSFGSGWAAVRHGEQDVRLYRLSDGRERRLPVVDDWKWDCGQYDGLRIAGDALWVRSWRGTGSDSRFITRFELDKLPEPVAR